MKPKISISKFFELIEPIEIQIGEIFSCERVPKSTKMLKLSVNFGEENTKTVLTNIGEHLGENSHVLVGMKFPFVTNLEPAKIMGITSEAMIVVPTNGESINLEGTPGSKLF